MDKHQHLAEFIGREGGRGVQCSASQCMGIITITVSLVSWDFVQLCNSHNAWGHYKKPRYSLRCRFILFYWTTDMLKETLQIRSGVPETKMHSISFTLHHVLSGKKESNSRMISVKTSRGNNYLSIYTHTHRPNQVGTYSQHIYTKKGRKKQLTFDPASRLLARSLLTWDSAMSALSSASSSSCWSFRNLVRLPLACSSCWTLTQYPHQC